MSAATAVAAGWLDEHLACAVPLTMCDLDRRARRCGGDYPAHVCRIADADVRDLQVAHGVVLPEPVYDEDGQPTGTRNSPTADSLAMTVATMGDTLYGESKPGRAAVVVTALTLGLAAAALTQAGGVDFRGQHFCRRDGRCTGCAR